MVDHRHPMRQLVEGLTESYDTSRWPKNERGSFSVYDKYNAVKSTHGDLHSALHAANRTHTDPYHLAVGSNGHGGWVGAMWNIRGQHHSWDDDQGTFVPDEDLDESTDLEEGHGMFRANLYGTNREADNDSKKYKIRRFHHKGHTKTLARGVSLSFAKSHCNHPETSSASCTNRHAKRYTAKHGDWFDGYSEDK